jgi:hypothetical protein
MALYAVVTERDCDNMEAVYTITAKNMALLGKKLDVIYDHAEGPVSAQLCSKKQYENFVGRTRDLAAEQAGY